MLVGLGLTPEAIETNPIMYDLMMENTWRGTTGVVDVTAWVGEYVSRRYAGFVPSTGLIDGVIVMLLSCRSL